MTFPLDVRGMSPCRAAMKPVDGEPGECGNLFVHTVQELRQFRISALFAGM